MKKVVALHNELCHYWGVVWGNRYDSEPMTKDEAEEYFDADNY